jgi:hypothetical protein
MTIPMLKHWKEPANIAMLKELSQSEVSKFTSPPIDETALARLK